MRALGLVSIVCLVLVGAYNIAMIVKAIARGSELAKVSEPFSRRVAGSSPRILVVGDSTAVGTGATAPEDSIAGRIAADRPDASVFNFAQDGALTAAVPAQLERASAGPYDLVLVQVGGNDALRFTRAENLRRAIEATLAAAVIKGQNTLLISVGDLGQAPAVPWPLSVLFSYRSRVVRDIFSDVAHSKGIRFLDLMAISGNENPFQTKPDKYYARDGLHPSSAGYGVWYQDMIPAVVKKPTAIPNKEE